MSVLTQPGSGDCSDYFLGYTAKVTSTDILSTLGRQGEDLAALLASLTEEQGDHRYAEGKWTLKQVVGHMADTERVFAYRALSAARGDETPLPGFDQDPWITGANFESRTLESLREELRVVRLASLSLFRSLSDEAWLRRAKADGKTFSTRAVPWIVAGHEVHHRGVIEERYL